MNNFPFEHNGETLWYSRSVAVSCYIFCKDKSGDWTVLVNKRGKGAPTAVGRWSVPAGYLDFNEDLAGCGIRETYEETGLVIPRVLMNFHTIRSIPDTKTLNVLVMYYVILPGTVDDYPTTNEHAETDEVDDIMFMPISMICTTNIDLAFNNGNIILDIYNKYIANSKN